MGAGGGAVPGGPGFQARVVALGQVDDHVRRVLHQAVEEPPEPVGGVGVGVGGRGVEQGAVGDEAVGVGQALGREAREDGHEFQRVARGGAVAVAVAAALDAGLAIGGLDDDGVGVGVGGEPHALALGEVGRQARAVARRERGVRDKAVFDGHDVARPFEAVGDAPALRPQGRPEVDPAAAHQRMAMIRHEGDLHQAARLPDEFLAQPVHRVQLPQHPGNAVVRRHAGGRDEVGGHLSPVAPVKQVPHVGEFLGEDLVGVDVGDGVPDRAGAVVQATGPGLVLHA